MKVRNNNLPHGQRLTSVYTAHRFWGDHTACSRRNTSDTFHLETFRCIPENLYRKNSFKKYFFLLFTYKCCRQLTKRTRGRLSILGHTLFTPKTQDVQHFINIKFWDMKWYSTGYTTVSNTNSKPICRTCRLIKEELTSYSSTKTRPKK